MRLACLLPLMALTACAAAAPPPLVPGAEPTVAEPPATCRNEPLPAFVGKARSDALARQLLAASKASTLRWVRPGMMVTMDYRADRLTVHLDASGRITRARCG